MKNLLFLTILFGVISTGCRKAIFLPVVGKAEGKIVNIHNKPIQGAEVTITHIPASESTEAAEHTISTTTDFEGNYLLEDVWDEFRIDVTSSGFKGQSEHHAITGELLEQQLDFKMIGSPEAAHILLSRSVLSKSDTTGMMIFVTAEDEYNDNSSGYTGDLLLTDERGILQSALSLSSKAEGNGKATLELMLLPGELSGGIYTLSAKVVDPDGNQLLTNSDEKLIIQE